jgi:hypothetical protein
MLSSLLIRLYLGNVGREKWLLPTVTQYIALTHFEGNSAVSEIGLICGTEE